MEFKMVFIFISKSIPFEIPPHFMGFVLVCPAAENQGEISDEMDEESSHKNGVATPA
jgi:hypothetical protein